MDVARWEREEICVEKGFDGKMQTGVSELRMEILIYDVRWEIEIGDLKWDFGEALRSVFQLAGHGCFEPLYKYDHARFAKCTHYLSKKPRQ
ncbi:MAG: hypothetical protein CL912_29020 [Deltaproteobacteria bacterium]|nr:hypothetical protein [Deltaproteobacteria bacterium]